MVIALWCFAGAASLGVITGIVHFIATGDVGHALDNIENNTEFHETI